jgi:hypothetical protein
MLSEEEIDQWKYSKREGNKMDLAQVGRSSMAWLCIGGTNWEGMIFAIEKEIFSIN